MKIIELVIDELQEDGVEAISVVESPAIEENFVALKSKSVEVKFSLLISSGSPSPKNDSSQANCAF